MLEGYSTRRTDNAGNRRAIDLFSSRAAYLSPFPTGAERQVEIQSRLVKDLVEVSRIHSDYLELRIELCDLVSVVGDGSTFWFTLPLAQLHPWMPCISRPNPSQCVVINVRSSLRNPTDPPRAP